jgi:hypothetical protein
MAQKKTEGAILISADGKDQVTAKSPAAITNYVYGQGYKPKSGTVEEAIETVKALVSDPPPTAEPRKGGA